MENYQSKFDKAAKFKAATETSKIHNSLIASVAEDICKDRMELAKKAMSKQKSLTGQLYSFNKPDIKGGYIMNSDKVRVKSPDAWSEEAIQKEAKLKENLEKLDLALTACLSTEFVLGPTEDVEATAEGSPAIKGMSIEKQQEKFAKEDETRWATLKRYTDKEDKDACTTVW